MQRAEAVLTIEEVPQNMSCCHYSAHLSLAYLWFHSRIKPECKVTSLGSPSPTTLDYPVSLFPLHSMVLYYRPCHT